VENEALHTLFSATYEELRRLAAVVRRDHPRETLNPTALVNEAYLKLADSLRIEPESRIHFRRIAAKAMRQVLVEAARRRSAQKRGSGQALVTFSDDVAADSQTSEEILALDSALQALAEMQPRQARVVECRFFGGLEVSETAEVLEVSESTVERDWRAARAWLATQLK
jgi:RNA polymerase sigma factor (TIGR02999 family)